jgi:hypothetical protein
VAGIRAEVPGLVEVKLGLEATGDADLVRRVEESIFSARAAGIRVVHNLPTRTVPESMQRAEAAQGGIPREEAVPHFARRGQPLSLIHLPAEVLNSMPEGILNLRAEVLLQLTERNLSASQKENIEDEARTRVKEYIEAHPMGEVLIYNKLLGQIVQPEEILDAALLIGPASGQALYSSNLATDGRKAKIESSSVFVGLMEAVVFIDMEVRMEAKNQTEGRPEVTPRLRSEIEDAVHRTLAASQGKVAKAELKTAIAAAIPAGDPGMQLIAGEPVILNAEYEETGRLLNNTEEIILEEHQVPELRQVNITIPGVLDG